MTLTLDEKKAKRKQYIREYMRRYRKHCDKAKEQIVKDNLKRMQNYKPKSELQPPIPPPLLL